MEFKFKKKTGQCVWSGSSSDSNPLIKKNKKNKKEEKTQAL